MKNINETVYQIISDMDTWFENNGWAGWDPYFINELPYIVYTQKYKSSYLGKIIHYGLFFFSVQSSKFLLPLFNVKKKIIPKGMGLLANGYLTCYEKTKKYIYLKKAIEILDWLENNSSSGYKNYCWGYPFDWYSLYFIPKNTPSVVVTKVIGDAFLKAYKITNSKKYINICKSICMFISQDLRLQSVDNSDEICISYTPIADNYVHNASLMGAEYLAKIGIETTNLEWIELSKKVTNYSINQQNNDGSFAYFGTEEMALGRIKPNAMLKFDNYHTGFIVRSLVELSSLFNDKNIRQAAASVSKYYLNAFVDDDGCPKMFIDSRFPIDIHSAAESILCINIIRNQFSNLADDAQKKLNMVYKWSIQNLWSVKNKYFYYKITRFGKIRVPFFRWNQSWMYFALTEIL
jgi:polysaccharide biosynthesis protein VpsJ